jgi:hypothetical protein
VTSGRRWFVDVCLYGRVGGCGDAVVGDGIPFCVIQPCQEGLTRGDWSSGDRWRVGRTSIHNGRHDDRSRYGPKQCEPDKGPALPHHDFRVRQGQIRLFDRSDEPDSDDASDMYVVEVFSVSALIRLRTPSVGEAPELYVPIENEGRPTRWARAGQRWPEPPHAGPAAESNSRPCVQHQRGVTMGCAVRERIASIQPNRSKT